MAINRKNAKNLDLCLMMFSSLTAVSVVLIVEFPSFLRQRATAHSSSGPAYSGRTEVRLMTRFLMNLCFVRPRYAVRKPAPRKGKRDWLGRGSPQRAMQHCAQKEPLSRCVNLRFLLIGAELGYCRDIAITLKTPGQDLPGQCAGRQCVDFGTRAGL